MWLDLKHYCQKRRFVLFCLALLYQPEYCTGQQEDAAVKQGYFGVFEVFVDTIVICTLTALIVLIGAEGNITYGVAAGAEYRTAGRCRSSSGLPSYR